MKIAIFQLPSPAGDTEAALATVAAGLKAAAAAGAGMAVFPEVFLPGYNQPDPEAQPLGGAWERRLAEAARAAGCGVTIGFAEAADGQRWNAALTLAPDGTRLAQYRKVQLFGPREQALYAPGDRFVTFDLMGRKTALLICYDIEFAPHIATLARQGVEVILCPTANMQPFTHVARLVVPTHAINHGVTIVYANYCGSEGDLDYCGGSLIVAPDGAILAQAGPDAAMIVADIARLPDPAMLQTQIADFRPVG